MPQSRWALAGRAATDGFGRRFGELVASGTDVDGEARLADALLPRGARVLDVGAGMGRVTAALAARGHTVVGIEPDPVLVEQAHSTYPGIDVLRADVLELDRGRAGDELLGERPHAFDLIVVVGNVMVFLAEGTERRTLSLLRDRLAPGGRILLGFRLVGPPEHARRYPAEEFADDAAAAGLRVDARFGSYELHAPNDEYTVWLLSAEPDS
ncbi:class I SAM-dependent methyltransferase [Nocardioides sp. CBS4Y-1]|uniref:Class I SAM-dependent methyltransferase n=1 Tax=Nocardioides acrostichi TaxID=2784339 RepID=A0A930V395_9ACTN|nr:class I SAM-dependent methyltransferase [Nocardioides acrostichi]